MTFLESLLSFANEILTFYIPIFSTFRFVASRDPVKITRILKFWCVLTITFPLQYLLSLVLAENLDIIVDLLLHVALIFDEFKYSQIVYDSIVRPFYINNQEAISKISQTLESYFEKKKEEVQSTVSQSATDKIRGFVGQILVGTLNPSGKKQGKHHQKRQIQLQQEGQDDSQDDEKDD